MKTSAFAFSLLLLGSTSLAHAEYKLVTADDSSLSSLCIAAAASPSQLTALARSHGVSPGEIDTVYCNEVPLKRFVQKYGPASIATPQGTSSVAVAGYLLRKQDTSPLTELCAAAAVSEQEYARVKEEHFKGKSAIHTEVLCNGQPLKSFVRKFRNADVRLVGLR